MKRSVWGAGILLVVILAVAAVVGAVWNNLSSEWTVEGYAAQYALDHSPLSHIESHDVFSADGDEEVFYGTDVFGRPWYAFVFGQPFQVKFASASGLKTSDSIQSLARTAGISPISIHLGYLSPSLQRSFSTTAPLAYEVYGHKPSGKPVYAYFDAMSGNLIWQYVLQGRVRTLFS